MEKAKNFFRNLLQGIWIVVKLTYGIALFVGFGSVLFCLLEPFGFSLDITNDENKIEKIKENISHELSVNSEYYSEILPYNEEEYANSIGEFAENMVLEYVDDIINERTRNLKIMAFLCANVALFYVIRFDNNKKQ